MTRIYLLTFAFILSFSNLIYSQESNVIAGNIIAMLRSNEVAEKLISDLQTVNGIKTNFKAEKQLSKSMHIFLFDFDIAVNEDRMLNAVKQNPAVLIAQFNHTFSERYTPDDTIYPNQWDMNNTITNADIDAPEAWDITTGGLTAQGDTIVVAVVDGGFDLSHQDLSFWKNYNEIPGNGIDDDGNGYVDDVKGWNVATSNDNIISAAHGTHVCGTVGAKGNNVRGVSGVNWNVKIMPVMYGSANEADVVIAYSYVMDNRRLYNQTNGTKGAFVVSTNSSFGVDLGNPASYPLWCAMYDSLGSVGILSACATANANYNVDVQGDIPTACASNWMIAVTNTTNTDAKNGTCGYGATTIDLGAPGTSILSTVPGNSYATLTGTSMATPHVAGAVALMYSVMCSNFITNYKANPAAVALMVKDSLLGAVDVIPSMNGGITVSGGRLNLFKSVKAMEHYCYASVPDLGDNEISFEILKAYPNPSQNSLNLIYSSHENVDIVFTDLLGREIKRINEAKSTREIQHTSIDLIAFSKGMYFITICAKNKMSNTIKVIVQ